MQLPPLIAIQSESLQLDNQDWRGHEDLELLRVDLRGLALFTRYLVVERLSLMELGKAVVKCRVVTRFGYLVCLFTGRLVLNHLISNLIVVLFEDFRVPLNGNEDLPDEVFLIQGSISRRYHTSIALVQPVACSTDIASSVDGLEHEWQERTVFLNNQILPVLAFPPSIARSVVLAVAFQENMGRSPNLIIQSPSTGD